MNISLVFFWTGLLSFLPVSELRGGIPFAMAQGLPWYIAYPFAAGINILAAPACWLFLSTLHGFFLKLSEKPRFSWYRRLFDRLIERAREKLRPGVEKWGWLGVAVFVAIPLPLTGAWTGTLGAWILGLGRGKTLLAVTLGVLIAGAIVSSVLLLGIEALHIFVKGA
ncbi:MAG: small multi-drug export protein [Spirochaetaceae bacterium]|nr:small multi-drug export protein [Spirochaetaceae bacterium]